MAARELDKQAKEESNKGPGEEGKNVSGSNNYDSIEIKHLAKLVTGVILKTYTFSLTRISSFLSFCYTPACPFPFSHLYPFFVCFKHIVKGYAHTHTHRPGKSFIVQNDAEG